MLDGWLGEDVHAVAAADLVRDHAGPEPATEPAAQERAHRWEQQQDAENVGDETGDEEQEARGEEQPAVDEMRPGHAAGVELCPDPAQRAGALTLHDPEAHDRNRQQQGDHLAGADPLGDLHHHGDLGDRDDDERSEQDEHRFRIVPLRRSPFRPRVRAS